MVETVENGSDPVPPLIDPPSVGRLPAPLIIDLRPAEQFAVGHLPGALHLDLWGLSLIDTSEAPLRAFMRRALADLNLTIGETKLQMRITINTGVALTGDIGSPRRREFTVLGDVVNTASRMEDEVAGPGEIVISGSTYERVKTKVKARPLGSRTLRGRATALDMLNCWTSKR